MDWKASLIINNRRDRGQREIKCGEDAWEGGKRKNEEKGGWKNKEENKRGEKTQNERKRNGERNRKGSGTQ